MENHSLLLRVFYCCFGILFASFFLNIYKRLLRAVVLLIPQVLESSTSLNFSDITSLRNLYLYSLQSLLYFGRFYLISSPSYCSPLFSPPRKDRSIVFVSCLSLVSFANFNSYFFFSFYIFNSCSTLCAYRVINLYNIAS